MVQSPALMRINERRDPSRWHDRAHAASLALIAMLAASVLVLTAGTQIYDTNFQTLWEATALLAGDHPYRDFFEWGLPLQAVVSAVAQVVSGHRLVGEFLVQWIFIIAAMVISLHLAIQLSRSIAASVVTTSLALVLLAATPTYHYPKLFFYPLALWLSWRYIEQPGVSRAAVLGLTTALAFLFRHDHGVFIGVLALVVFGLTRIAVPASRKLRPMAVESAAYTIAAASILIPWLAIVQLSEGVPEYVQSRAYPYEVWSVSGSPYSSLLTMNPIRTLIGDRSVPPRPAAVSFTWNAHIDSTQRAELERQYELRPLYEGPDDAGRWHYEVPNVYDAGLWDLRGHLENADSSEGLDWEQLERLRSPWLVPTRDAAELWLFQVVLLVPILLVMSAGVDAMRAWHERKPIPLDCLRMTAAAVFLFVIERFVFRETSYVMAVAPLTAGLSARLLTGRPTTGRHAYSRLGVFWLATRWGVVAIVLFVTSLATFAYTRGSGIFNPYERARTVGPVFAELMTSPPIDGYQPSAAARATDWHMWNTGAVDKSRVLLRYLHDCTREDDRILVTGSTPYHINYYTNRSVAGGHLFWHIGWRSDTARQMKSLALLQRQSVPFAFSTHDPVLDDLKRYPTIREYFQRHYVELDGTGGLVLVDTRREPTSRFGRLGFPCFG